MSIHIHIHLDVALSTRQKRIVRGAVALGATIGALGLGVAVAAPKSTFAAGEPLSSQKLNDALVDLDARIVRPVRTAGGSSISLGGVYVAKTGPTDGRFIDPTTGQPNGYRAAKHLCEAAAKSPTAHMCDNSEMVRSDQLGVLVAPLVAADTSLWVAGAPGKGPGDSNTRDCLSWSLNITSEYAGSWTVNESVGVPVPGTSQNGAQECSTLRPIACCD